MNRSKCCCESLENPVLAVKIASASVKEYNISGVSVTKKQYVVVISENVHDLLAFASFIHKTTKQKLADQLIMEGLKDIAELRLRMRELKT